MPLMSLRSRSAGRALALVSLIAVAAHLPLQAADGEKAGAAGQLETKSLLGGYLAGRIARGQHDTGSASEFYRDALTRDPSNEAILEQALLMDATEGHFSHAVGLARKLIETQPQHRVARLVLALSEAKAGAWAPAAEQFKSGATGVMGELTSTLGRAWSLTAQGDAKAATQLLDGMRQAEWAQFFLRYHKALILDVAGQSQEASQVFERLWRADSKSLRLALAYAHHASAVGDQRLARQVMDEHARKVGGALHPVARALVEQLKGQERTPLLVQTAADGLSEVFYGLGEALAAEGGVSVGAIYLQMAIYLKEDQPFALSALASVYEATKRYDKAIEAYDRVPQGSPLQPAIDIRKALNLDQLERVDEAKTVLEKMAAADPTDIRALDALGTIMRGHKRFAEAADYYTRAIEIIGPRPEKKHWTYFYARGTCYERIKKWPLAEADLQKAMQLAPDQPLVLNYLGYSWVDQNRNLKQGLQLIERAVQLKPDDGYIVDSLGWAQYRLGNYREAVRHLERAVELKPEDPVLNDHLGDALWQVDRRREARFQWEQALTLKPEAEDAEKIRKKIAAGLPTKTQARTAKKQNREASRSDAPKKQTRLPQKRVVE